MFKIEKEVPTPISGGGDRNVYPFKEMDVGDSVFFAGKTHRSKEATAARNYFLKNGKKSTARLENGGVRVWRIL